MSRAPHTVSVTGFFFLARWGDYMQKDEFRKHLDQLIAQSVMNQTSDPMHRNEWIKIRESLQDALNELNELGS